MLYENLEKVKLQKPLIHHITNWVTIYDCANITRSFGALPVMAHAIEEAAQMASIASALVLNIGTLTPALISSMEEAGKKANEKGIPVVLDAVGVGATALRNEKSKQLLDTIHVDIIKGNASEIAKLAGEDVQTKGVESSKVESDLIEIAKKLASERGCTVAITGKEDIISNGQKTYIIQNGHEMMGSIVGTGCMSASVIGCFAAVEKNYADAAASALIAFGIAGELAAKKAKGPGSFKERFYDEAYSLNQKKIKKLQKYDEKNA